MAPVTARRVCLAIIGLLLLSMASAVDDVPTNLTPGSARGLQQQQQAWRDRTRAQQEEGVPGFRNKLLNVHLLHQHSL